MAAENHRLHKILDDAGIKRGAGVSDIDGVAARAMMAGLIAGEPMAQVPPWAKGKLRHKQATLHHALTADLSPRHRLVRQQSEGHRCFLESDLATLDASLIDAMAP